MFPTVEKALPVAKKRLREREREREAVESE